GTKETIYIEQTEDQYTICSRTTSEQAQTVYELYTNYKDPEYTSNTRLKYIPNAYYEYAHEQPETDFNHYVVIDNSRGYWNMLSFWLSESLGSGVLQNLVSTDDACYEFVADFRKGEEFNFYYTILSPDLSTDLLTISEADSGISLQLNGFKGIQSARSCAESDIIDSDGDVAGRDLEVVLTNGNVLSPGDTFLDGAVTYDYTGVFPMNIGDVYSGAMQFSVEGASVKERLQTLQEVLSPLGITGKHSMSSVIEYAPEAVTQAHNFGSYYTWNGHYFDSYEGILDGIKVERQKYGVYESAYAEAEKLPKASLGEGENLPNGLDFASVAALTGNASYKDGALSVENLSLSVNDLTLIKEGERYQLVLALAKKEDGELKDSLVVPFENASPTIVTYAGEESVTVTQTATYTLSDKLSSGEYAVVAYAATADGIRVSRLKELTFTATTEGTLEYTGASVKATLTAENTLHFNYEMKVDLWISADEEKLIYTKEEMTSLLLTYVLSYGYPMEESVLELYDETSKTGVAAQEGELASGVYRLKYYRLQGEEKMEGYVYCRLP
ncbi:MAG: hypothetical protein IJY26_03910, partial [Clostridia bacterium]|nr:hypothetical protein [Clostridia bacterium]